MASHIKEGCEQCTRKGQGKRGDAIVRWNGTSSSRLITGPTTDTVAECERLIVDMTAPAADTTVNVPNPTEDEVTVGVVVLNPDRHVLTIQGGTFKDFRTGQSETVIATRLRFFSVFFTYLGGIWYLDDFTTPGISPTLCFGASWQPRTTNGPCTIDEQYNVVSVERTGEGEYDVTVEPGCLNVLTLVSPDAYVENLGAQESWEINVKDKGFGTPDVILLECGYRDKNGKFRDDDLAGNANNRLQLVGQEIP